tara:strand:- start:17172 stop:18911 length:1740 start_codon:yes stop_codon:yes gene_type:complete
VIKIIMPISDQTLYTLKMSSFLFDKYWPEDTKIDVVGFQKPDFEISDKMNFVSIAPEQVGKANSWSKYILQYLESLDDELILFTLEDFFPTASPKIGIVSKVISLMTGDKRIGRFDLTFDSYTLGQYTTVKESPNLSIISKDKFVNYRVSTQPSIWRRKFLIEILKRTTTPWDFEINGSRLSSGMDYHVLAFSDPTFKKFPTYWIHKGAVSRYYPNKINVLGLDTDTIQEMVSAGLFNEEDLQWGMWNGEGVPTFHDLGGYDFNPADLPRHEASLTNWEEYAHVYTPKKLVINLFDNTFSHTKKLWGYITATGVDMWGKPQGLRFVQNNMKYDGITFFVDDYACNTKLVENVQSKFKVAWLLEPKALKPRPHSAILEHHDKFDLVITHNQDLIDKFDNCKYIQQAECRVAHEDWGIHDKTKMVSLIAAKKKILEGHRFRYEVADKLQSKHGFDLFGAAFGKWFENKTDALRDYMFSITIHNTIENNFFTDGIIDCFALGTVPIFRGCPNIGEFFDKDGIICFETIEELDEILSNLTEESYYKRMDSIKKNYEIAKKFKRTNEDQIIGAVKTYLDNLEKS